MQEFKRLINEPITNIWRYASFYPPIGWRFHLANGEGWTRLEKADDLYFKREDKNPTGSVKDRGFSYQISDAYQNSEGHLVISSSGNAAISAAVYCRLANIKLSVFISPRINKYKLEQLRRLSIDLHVTENPLRDASFFRRENRLRNIRQSLDPMAVPGYKSLGFELFENLRNEKKFKWEQVSIFLPVSSGTTLVGVGRAFLALKELGFIKNVPQLHAVQTVYINPIASVFYPTRSKIETRFGLGLASAICAPKTARKKEILSLVYGSKGRGWIVSDEEINFSLKWLKKQGIVTSAEGAAALSALFKAQKKMDIGLPVCVLTGKKY